MDKIQEIGIEESLEIENHFKERLIKAWKYEEFLIAGVFY